MIINLGFIQDIFDRRNYGLISAVTVKRSDLSGKVVVADSDLLLKTGQGQVLKLIGNRTQETIEYSGAAINAATLTESAGALSGTEDRHPLGSPSVEPIGSGRDYRIDVERARRLEPLVREGFADDLVEAAIRFVIANDAVSTALVGYSTLEQLEHAAVAANKGPIPPAALDRLKTLHSSFVGEAR